jgi:glyoxylase-like metal-dependent hydrolase (beta-lactamase superfamily II)
MHPDDESIAREHFNKTDMIKWYIETRVPVRFPGEGHVEALTAMVSDEDYPFFQYKPIKDGDTWDLGGRIIEALHTPGHSPGSVCFLDKANRILYSGDTVNIGIIIPNKPEGTEKDLAIYRDSIAKIWNRQEEFDKLAIGHDGGLIDKGIVKDYLDLATGILEGSIVGQYEEVGIRKGVVARLGAAELWYRCDA